jgi:hypothetical protein
MKRLRLGKTEIAAIAAALLLLGGIAALLAGAGGGGGRAGSSTSAALRTRSAGGRGALATAAAYLGVSKAQLRSEIRSGTTMAQIAASTPGRTAAGLIDALVAAGEARVQADLAAGRVTHEKEAAKLAKVREGAAQEVDSTRSVPSPSGAGLDLPAAARYLGTSPKRLRARLNGGTTTLAAIASATHGRSVAGLIDAIVTARTAKLKAAVAEGRVAPAREQEMLTKLRGRVTEAVNQPVSGTAASTRSSASRTHGESSPSHGESSPSGGEAGAEAEAPE